MKNILLNATIGLFISLSIIGLPALAQTPDGMTPANEGVCDILQADGTTKGLYGLCVAFCEAQDHTSSATPISEADYDALAAAAPSGKLLSVYNKKKQSNDPGMPCIVYEEEGCPCWSADEFASIDGYIETPDPDTSLVDHFNCVTNDVSSIGLVTRGIAEKQSCATSVHPSCGLFGLPIMRNNNSAAVVSFRGNKKCLYNAGGDEGGAPLISRLLSTAEGTLTAEQYEFCRADVITAESQYSNQTTHYSPNPSSSHVLHPETP